MTSTGIEIRRPIAQFIEAYQKAMNELCGGFEQARRARCDLERLFEGGQSAEYSGWEIRDLQTKAIKSVRRKAWKTLLERLGVEKILSSERQAKLDASLDSENAPDITVEAVVEILELLQSNDLAHEAILEAFEELRPGKWQYDRYKTNKKAPWKVFSKIVLTGMVRVKYGGGGFQPAYARETKLAMIDRTFHLLDGALDEFDSNAYRSPLVDAIHTAKDGRGETKYFRFRCHRNGNLHLQIKRLDLLEELNRLGGEGRREIGVEA